MYPDDLGYDPIDPPSLAARAEFRGDVMLFEDNPTIAEQTSTFWADVAANAFDAARRRWQRLKQDDARLRLLRRR